MYSPLPSDSSYVLLSNFMCICYIFFKSESLCVRWSYSFFLSYLKKTNFVIHLIISLNTEVSFLFDMQYPHHSFLTRSPTCFFQHHPSLISRKIDSLRSFPRGLCFFLNQDHISSSSLSLFYLVLAFFIILLTKWYLTCFHQRG